jgi:light-regulated signal transduction histidine kinase (bacteriophytochrome)
MMDEKGKTASVLSLVLDITSQIETERELKENAERLTWSNAELQQFAYVASHDLQEPLRMVVSYLTLLDRRYSNDLDPQALEFRQYAVEGGERMRALIDALLAYSRVDTKGKEFGLVDMGSVMEDVIQVLSVPIGETKAEITVGPMPTIAADGSQMFQLMQNLVNNAIKFNEGPQPIIRVYADKAENLWKFAVTDNGIGIDAKYSEKIFQMFQRLHTKEEYPGNGVGLAIAKKIAERHGGRIWVESEEGMGAAFYFTIDEKAGS